LSDSFFKIRETAAGKIDLICSPEATDQVLLALNDPISTVRREAATRLSQSTGSEVKAALQHSSKSDPDEGVRTSAKQSIWRNDEEHSAYILEQRRHCNNTIRS